MTQNQFLWTKAWLGIDPGKTGAYAIILEASAHNRVKVWDYLDTSGLIFLELLQNSGVKILSIIEKQQAYPKQGVVSMFKLGENYGMWQGYLSAKKIPFEIVSPAKWKKNLFGIKKKPEDQKTASLEMARRLYPHEAGTYLTRKKDHNRAEAILLAHYLKRIS